MALFNCPECSKQISDKAVSCPNCGFPLSELEKEHRAEPALPKNLNWSSLYTCPNCGKGTPTGHPCVNCGKETASEDIPKSSPPYHTRTADNNASIIGDQLRMALKTPSAAKQEPEKKEKSDKKIKVPWFAAGMLAQKAINEKRAAEKKEREAAKIQQQILNILKNGK